MPLVKHPWQEAPSGQHLGRTTQAGGGTAPHFNSLLNCTPAIFASRAHAPLARPPSYASDQSIKKEQQCHLEILFPLWCKQLGTLAGAESISFSTEVCVWWGWKFPLPICAFILTPAAIATAMPLLKVMVLILEFISAFAWNIYAT